MPHALHFLIFTAAGWLNCRQEDLIEYLREENRVLREQLGGRPLRLTDTQRRRLAILGQKLGRRVLSRVAGIVTPDTILRWYRRLIAQKYDGSARRRRPLTRQAIGELVVRMAIENPRWGYTRPSKYDGREFLTEEERAEIEQAARENVGEDYRPADPIRGVHGGDSALCWHRTPTDGASRLLCGCTQEPDRGRRLWGPRERCRIRGQGVSEKLEANSERVRAARSVAVPFFPLKRIPDRPVDCAERPARCEAKKSTKPNTSCHLQSSGSLSLSQIRFTT